MVPNHQPANSYIRTAALPDDPVEKLDGNPVTLAPHSHLEMVGVPHRDGLVYRRYYIHVLII
jgi:hypothetical protein